MKMAMAMKKNDISVVTVFISIMHRVATAPQRGLVLKFCHAGAFLVTYGFFLDVVTLEMSSSCVLCVDLMFEADIDGVGSFLNGLPLS